MIAVIVADIAMAIVRGVGGIVIVIVTVSGVGGITVGDGVGAVAVV